MTYQKILRKLSKIYNLQLGTLSIQDKVIYNLLLPGSPYYIVALSFCYKKKRTRIAIAPNIRINNFNKIAPANDDGSYIDTLDEYLCFDNSSFDAIQKQMEKLIRRKKELDIGMKLDELGSDFKQ